MMDGSLFPDLDHSSRPDRGDLPPMIIDSFAGGGGASTGIEMALGRSPDVAVNHDARALAMHQANHPTALHLNSNVWHVDPSDVCRGRRVGLAWFSPDCKHHSKAKGGKPLKKNIRDLAWIVVLWARRVRPEIIILENVEEFAEWGPLTPENKPCPDRRGQTFRHWLQQLRRLGYKVEWKELRACDFGAPTIRKRLFLIARCDGRKISWPKPTHGAPDSDQVRSGQLQPWRTAAEIIDWTLPCPSIFDSAEDIMAKHGLRAVRPLKDATLRRIARGVMRYVIEEREPFLVTYGQQGGGNRSALQPHHTITASPKDQNAIVMPTLVQTGYGERAGQLPRAPGLDKPLGTVVAGGGKHALVSAFLAQHNTGATGRRADAPVSTLTTRATQQQVVAAHLMNMHGSTRRSVSIETPHPTLTAGGQHGAIVAAFLQKYYGQGTGQPLNYPFHTIATRDTFGLVTVEINGSTYAISDIGMRMLTPREQFRAQGFPERYIIETAPDGSSFTKTEQTRMCGNSVCPPIAAALVKANCSHLAATHERIAS
jgi:DNA (cytosine-5)-methyltransferase 1